MLASVAGVMHQWTLETQQNDSNDVSGDHAEQETGKKEGWLTRRVYLQTRLHGKKTESGKRRGEKMAERRGGGEEKGGGRRKGRKKHH